MGEKKIQFRVSSSLKSIVGKDLITDKFAAIFELVKNSIDARASRIDVVFELDEEEPSIWVVDNGKGMSSDDINDKWLFLGYSAKKEGKEDEKSRVYAGNKGVGRFSCDRLGSKLRVYGKTSNCDHVNSVRVDWDDFEEDSQKEFAEIDIYKDEQSEFLVPMGIKLPKTGVIIKVSGLREGASWQRDKLLKLKRSLFKLVDPFGGSSRGPKIYLHCQREKKEDNGLEDDVRIRDSVNGRIQNDILEVLESKTTKLTCFIDARGSFESELKDRGELIYRIKEEIPREFEILRQSGFKAEVYYLNQSAKSTFTRRMGVTPRDYGSLFLYKNDFHIFPVGEPDNDYWKLDRRKAQGYSRFVGTRDVMGRIDVRGDENTFKESSSRDKGFIDSVGSYALNKLVLDVIKKFEKYVVGVSWRDKPDKHESGPERLFMDENKARVIQLVSSLANDEDIEILDFNKNLVSLLSRKSSQYEEVLTPLKAVVAKYQDENLSKSIKAAERALKKAKAEQQAALDYAEKEAKAREEAEKEAEALKAGIEEEKKNREVVYTQNVFLKNLVSADVSNLVGLHHHIRIAAGTIQNYVSDVSRRIKKGKPMTSEMFLTVMDKVGMQASQIWSATRFATKANFVLDAAILEDHDLFLFVKEHVMNVCEGVVKTKNREDMIFTWSANEISMIVDFRPLEIAVVIDNLINNSNKAGSTKVDFVLEEIGEKKILKVIDDGIGVKDAHADKLFDMGYTTTIEGSGFGLYHAKEIVESLGGSIYYKKSEGGGATFVIEF